MRSRDRLIEVLGTINDGAFPVSAACARATIEQLTLRRPSQQTLRTLRELARTGSTPHIAELFHEALAYMEEDYATNPQPEADPDVLSDAALVDLAIRMRQSQKVYHASTATALKRDLLVAAKLLEGQFDRAVKARAQGGML